MDSKFPLPTNSALLDRLKQFLPEMAKANAELEEKIAQEGQEKFVIDKHLLAQEHQDNDADEADKDSEDQEENGDKPLVQVEFALGDFDGTPIGIAEEDSDNEDNVG